MTNALKQFEHALLISRVANRFAMEHDTPEAMKKYLQEHPGADRSNHKVKNAPGSSDSKGDSGPSDDDYQGSDAYKTKRDPEYYPEKAPKGMKYPSELGSLPKHVEDAVMEMTEIDLDKDKSYRHPALKRVQKSLMKRLKTEKDEVMKEFRQLEDLRDEISRKARSQKTDATADPYRFAGRKLYHAWQAYSAAIQEHGRKAR
jgi:hypothetical protein